MDSLQPRPASYYYKNCFILHIILEPWTLPKALPSRNAPGFFRKKRSKKIIDNEEGNKTNSSLIFSYVRFLLVLSVWLILLYFACSHYGILTTVKEQGDKPKIIGLLNDYVNYGICFWMIAAMALLLLVLRKLDTVLLNFVNIVDCAGDQQELKRLKAEIERARNFISINSPRAKWTYRALILVSTVLVLWYALALPLLPHTAHSWALEPASYPVVFVIAQPWAYFWVTVVFANFVWFEFCIIYFVFWRASVYASQKRIIVPPISIDERGGLRTIGELVFMVMILASGGLTIAVGWVIIFEKADDSIRFVIALYVVILALLYILPISYLSIALKYSREKHLSALGVIFTTAYSAVVGATGAAEVNQTKNAAARPPIIEINRQVDELASIDMIYTRVEKMPRSPVSMFMNIIATVYLSTPLIFGPTFLLKLTKDAGSFRNLFDKLGVWFQ